MNLINGINGDANIQMNDKFNKQIKKSAIYYNIYKHIGYIYKCV